MLQERCPNDNHGRAIVTVRCCPTCGVVVIKNILARACSDEKHAKSLRDRSVFCPVCGQQLARSRSDG